jgi:hypothetical protein
MPYYFLNSFAEKYQPETIAEWGFKLLKIVFGRGLCPLDPYQNTLDA